MGEDGDDFAGAIIADLHIHSKYSRATSKDLDLVNTPILYLPLYIFST